MAARVVLSALRPALFQGIKHHQPLQRGSLLARQVLWGAAVPRRTWASSPSSSSPSSSSSSSSSSSPSSPSKPASHSTTAVEDAQTLIEREHFAKVRRKLENDTRKKISYKEFQEICVAEGLSKEQAKQLSQSLTDAGNILHFANSSNAVLRDYVFLQPVEFNKTVSRILSELSDDTYLREQLATKKTELAAIKSELQPLEAQLESLHKKAASRATLVIWTGLGYCVLQAVIVARLTWWELSWDVMEPVTYMLTFATALIGYSYFVLTGTEYTYEGLRKTLEHRKLDKLVRRSGFDMATLRKLQEAALVREAEVKNILLDLQSDPVTLHLKDPSKPVV